MAIDLSDITPRGLLPDPEPRPVRYTIFSVDDHLVEPPDLFEGRMPAKLADQAPRVVEMDDGSQQWQFNDHLYPQIGLNAVAGRAPEGWTMEPARFDEMRRGCWDVHERIRDMDINGVWASVNFPSVLPGFAGTVFAHHKDPEVGLAAVRAWNDWHLEEWCGAYPDRLVPVQLPWLPDPEVAAEEIRSNAERGFRAVTFADNPAALRYPSPHSGHWDPFLAACAETGTVLCLHAGSSGHFGIASKDFPHEQLVTMFGVCALSAAAEWLWSGVTEKFPGLRIAMSEGGIGWVPMLLDRVEYIMSHSAKNNTDWSWPRSPSETLRENFWFCTIDDPSTLELRHRIGIDHIMLESDYPHSDSTWPDTQVIVHERIGHLPPDEIAKLTHRNASALFGLPIPTDGPLPRRG